MTIRFQLLSPTALPPQKMTEHSAGWDLSADLQEPEILEPGDRAAIPTGIAVEIPPCWEGQIRPRSGLALHSGLGILNSPGTIDADYRGEIKVILINHGTEDFEIRRGDRIGQLVFAPVFHAVFAEVEALDETARGTGGFGSTGV